jgi:SAM-dependent methyltransferase
MSSRGDLGVPVEDAQDFFEQRWRDGDPWEVERSRLDQESYGRQLALLEGRRYGRALELGCGAGSFTRRLAQVADSVVAIDIAPSAIERALASSLDPAAIDFRVANIMDYEPRAEGPWDLVVMSETIYYLGWLYPLFRIGWLASELFAGTRTGGRFLMANTCGTVRDHLLLPWLVRTYRDLFLNVGYSLEAEEVVRGAKHSVEYEILVDLFAKPVEATG